ncbi:Concanavalin A-like lectin/glucanases superfamily protein [uncultured archaeon]|nr:Concanavalin A-like lectin/glucanases superfamily protein [uncultured archaeon]
MGKRVLAACILLMLGGCAFADIRTGLTGYWKFDENTGTTTADSSGNVYPGYRGNLISSPVWAQGYTNSDLNFFSGGYVDINVPLGSFMSASTGTMAGWMYIIAGNGSGADGSCGGISDAQTSNGGYIWLCAAADGYFYAGGYSSSNQWVRAQSTLNTWKHLAWVHGGGNLFLYVDGNKVGPLALGNLLKVDQNMTISRGFNGLGIKGLVDEVRIYNRALSDSDINELYYCQPPTIVGKDWVIDRNTNCDLNAAIYPATSVAIGKNLDIRNGTLNINSNQLLAVPSGSKAYVRAYNGAFSSKIWLRTGGKLMVRK